MAIGTAEVDVKLGDVSRELTGLGGKISGGFGKVGAVAGKASWSLATVAFSRLDVKHV